ncbi:MAG: glycosyltransferase [Acidobacteria bacterium]|nr:glycosyltransferase [Acidobacteriota bacterium]
MQPEVSVLIPTLDFPDVAGVVKRLCSQTAKTESFEVIVSDCDRAEWEEPLAPLGREIDLHYLRVRRHQLARTKALNAALEKARGELILFLSGDFTPGPNFVDLHLEFHRKRPSPECVAIGPSKFVQEQGDERFVQWLEADGRIFGMNGTDGDAGGFFYVGNSSLKRELIDRAGMFDTDFPYEAFDDYEYGQRLRAAGMKSFYLPEALVWHEHDHAPTLADRSRSMMRAGESVAIFERKHPGPHDWSASCARHPLRLEADAAYWGLRYLFRRSPEDLGGYYGSRLDAAFVRGWRKGRQCLT